VKRGCFEIVTLTFAGALRLRRVQILPPQQQLRSVKRVIWRCPPEPEVAPRAHPSFRRGRHPPHGAMQSASAAPARGFVGTPSLFAFEERVVGPPAVTSARQFSWFALTPRWCLSYGRFVRFVVCARG
jgi:hypothetical protein